MKKWLITLAVMLLLVVGAGYVFRDRLLKQAFAPTASDIEEGITLDNLINQEQTPVIGNTPDTRPTVETVATDLEVPWEIAWLPNGNMLITQRSGSLLLITPDENQTNIPIPSAVERGESGLLGLTLHPDFSRNNYIYVYLTTNADNGLINRVERYRLVNGQLTDRVTIIDNIPGAQYHDGGRIAFGPDKYLYITTGDAGMESSAQDTNSLAGKILRLQDDGAMPNDNPFGNAVWSYGHRNPQGLAWDNTGQLWATEHGRSGAQSGFDELNRIEKGKNYGWPTIEGDESRAGMETPVIHSGARDTWAPAGLIFWDGIFFFTGLRGESLYEAQVVGNSVINLKRHFSGEYGRLRAISIGPDEHFYISTSNTDGRGGVAADDDKIIRINPRIFR